MLPHRTPSDTPAEEATGDARRPAPAGVAERLARRQKRALWIAMVVGVVFGGAAFAYKIVEFMFTLSAPEARGFAEVPVTVYFFVAAGWLCLLLWCFATGKFKNNEQAKYDMLEMEEEYERRGI